MTRVISYIDGFNLYFGLRSKGWRKYYWLDLVALSESLLKPGQTLEHCHYFTARVAGGSASQSAKRQTLWLDALTTRQRMTTHLGQYLQKPQKCRSCGATWTSYEEKMTDVNIAAQLLVDGYNNRYDTALIISGDSDLTTPVSLVRSQFPGKRVIVAFPPDRHSQHLRRTANGAMAIGEDKLRHNLLPNAITAPNGFVIHRPAQWY